MHCYTPQKAIAAFQLRIGFPTRSSEQFLIYSYPWRPFTRTAFPRSIYTVILTTWSTMSLRGNPSLGIVLSPEHAFNPRRNKITKILWTLSFGLSKHWSERWLFIRCLTIISCTRRHLLKVSLICISSPQSTTNTGLPTKMSPCQNNNPELHPRTRRSKHQQIESLNIRIASYSNGQDAIIKYTLKSPHQKEIGSISEESFTTDAIAKQLDSVYGPHLTSSSYLGTGAAWTAILPGISIMQRWSKYYILLRDSSQFKVKRAV